MLEMDKELKYAKTKLTAVIIILCFCILIDTVEHYWAALFCRCHLLLLQRNRIMSLRNFTYYRCSHIIHKPYGEERLPLLSYSTIWYSNTRGTPYSIDIMSYEPVCSQPNNSCYSVRTYNVKRPSQNNVHHSSFSMVACPGVSQPPYCIAVRSKCKPIQ